MRSERASKLGPARLQTAMKLAEDFVNKNEIEKASQWHDMKHAHRPDSTDLRAGMKSSRLHRCSQRMGLYDLSLENLQELCRRQRRISLKKNKLQFGRPFLLPFFLGLRPLINCVKCDSPRFRICGHLPSDNCGACSLTVV